ncbi:Protein of unknown function [Bacillus mycoides]|nr:Protein of unknown function [Bacillus mycoides]
MYIFSGIQVPSGEGGSGND